MSKFILVSVVGGLLSLSAWAAPSATVAVTLSPAGSFKGTCSKVEGSAYRTADGVAAEDIKVDLRTLKTGIELRDKHTRKHLGVDKNPYASLVNATGKDGVGKAQININGVQKEVTGTYKIVGKELHAEFKLHLPDLQIEGISYMGVGVDDDVVVAIVVPIGDKK